MDNQNQIPAVSTAEAEAFWTGGNDARQPETGADLQPETSKKILIAWIPYIHEWRQVFECDPSQCLQGRYHYCLDPGDGLPTHLRDGDGIEVVETTEADCLIAATAWTLAHPQGEIGIDTPGVGVVRPEVSSLELRSGRESAGDGVGERSPDLVGSLIAAARELALAQIEPADETEPAFCTECTKDATDGGAIAHEDDCLTGRVIRSIVNLVESRQISKEAATDGDAHAGDGTRPRGLYQRGDIPAAIDLLCLACGERGGEWLRGRMVRRGEAITYVGNQRLAADADGSGFYIYTHQCAAVANGGAR